MATSDAAPGVEIWLLGKVPSHECRDEAEDGQCECTEAWKSSGLSVCRTHMTHVSSQQHAWL